MTRRVAAVFGGSGFIGRHLVQRLAAAGYGVRVAVRDPIAAEILCPAGDVGQIVPFAADVTNEASVRRAVAGAELVVNLVGILAERGKNRFQSVQAEGAGRIAAAAAAAGVRRLVHVSAIGADIASPSSYARSKGQGEEAVLAAFPKATIIRPSLVFGPEDDFYNRFAAMTGWSPLLPVFVGGGLCRMARTCKPFGDGGARFQPVYVGDVAEALMIAATSDGHEGRIYELGGPAVYNFKQIQETVLTASGRRRWLLPVPLRAAAWLAGLLAWLPNPPLTRDQVVLLGIDNVATGAKPGLAALGITPTSVESVVPTYLSRFRERGLTAGRS